MQREQCEEFIEQEIKGLYPTWKPSPKAAALWVNQLMPFDWPTAKQAVNNCYAQFSAREPRLDKVISLCRKHRAQRSPEPQTLKEPILAFMLNKLGTPDNRRFYRKRGPLAYFDERNEEAHRLRELHESTYGGEWAVTIAEVETERPDDGLRGKEAQQRAYRNILAGPDTAGKRLLQKLQKGASK